MVTTLNNIHEWNEIKEKISHEYDIAEYDRGDYLYTVARSKIFIRDVKYYTIRKNSNILLLLIKSHLKK